MQHIRKSLFITAILFCCSLSTQAMVAIEAPNDTHKALPSEAIQKGGVITAVSKNFITIDHTNYYFTHKTKRYGLNATLNNRLVLEEGMLVNFTIINEYNKLKIIQLWLMKK